MRGIPVSEYLEKSDSARQPRLTVLRACRPYEDKASNWACDAVVSSLRSLLPELQVHDTYLSSYRILPYVSNDPNSKTFNPADQFPAVADAIKDAQAVLIGFYETHGMPDSNIVRMLERIYAQQHAEGEANLFERRKFIGVVGHGGHRAAQAVSSVALTFNDYGNFIVGKGCVSFDRHNGDIYKSDEFAHKLQVLANQFKDSLSST